MKRQIVLIASLVAGLLAAVLTRVYLSVKENEVATEKARLYKQFGTMRALYFVRDTPAGSVLSREDLDVKTVPAMGMRGQALTEENMDVVGRRTLVGRKKGEIVFWSDIEGGDPAARGLSADIKRQMRAISINVTGSSSVSCMVKPNDHVDVIGTFNFPDENGKLKKGDLVTCTLLQNVLVVATGRDTAKSVTRSLGSSREGYSTVTLEVTPREAEMLAFAEQIKGRLVLTLRNRNDTSTERELPTVDFDKIRSEIEELNLKRQQERLTVDKRIGSR